MATTVNRIQSLPAEQVKAELEAGRATLIDVREPIEPAGERIPGAKLMPLSKFDPAELSAANGKIILHCRSGSRSAKAAQKLLEAGHAETFQLQGGIEA